MKRLATLVAGLTLFVPALHYETTLVHNLNAALDTGGDASTAPPHLDLHLPHSVESLAHAFQH